MLRQPSPPLQVVWRGPSFAQSRQLSFHHRGQPLHCRSPLRFSAVARTCSLVYLTCLVRTPAVFLSSTPHTRDTARAPQPCFLRNNTPIHQRHLPVEFALSISTPWLNESCALVLALHRLATRRCGDFLGEKDEQERRRGSRRRRTIRQLGHRRRSHGRKTEACDCRADGEEEVSTTPALFVYC